jgi:transposase-like protein
MPFAGLYLDREVIVLCVRLYLRYKRSFRELYLRSVIELLGHLGISVSLL